MGCTLESPGETDKSAMHRTLSRDYDLTDLSAAFVDLSVSFIDLNVSFIDLSALSIDLSAAFIDLSVSFIDLSGSFIYLSTASIDLSEAFIDLSCSLGLKIFLVLRVTTLKPRLRATLACLWHTP